MKTKIFAAILMTTLFAGSAYAQLKVKTVTGKVKIGQEPPVGFGTDDPYEVLTVHVYGPNGDARAASKMAFGDFGRHDFGGWNAFIGEYSDYDSDQLWLHGKRGMYMTYNNGDDIIGYYDVAAGNKFTFNCDVYSYGIMLASDARFKTNVKKLDNALEQILKLDGVSYNLLPHVISAANGSGTATHSDATDKTATANGKPSAKEMRDKAYFDELEKQKQQPGPKRLGFIAQEVQKVFPDLVKKDSSNYMYVDYIGLIPVIVEALKDQEKIIDAQSEKIKEMEARLSALESKLGSTGDDPLNIKDGTAKASSSFLYQNTPNPFTAKTDISYFLTDDVKNASIYVYDMQGTLLKSYQLKGTGKGMISINGSELKPGMYIYAMIADGKEVDVKRMNLIN